MTSEKTDNILLCALFSFIFSMGLSQIADYDIFYHLATGKYILETGKINQIDPFSFTAGNTPLSIQSWLSGVVFYWVYTIGGLNGLIICKAILLTLVFFILYKTMQVTGAKGYLTLFTLIVVAFVVRFRMSIRPHIFEFLFLAIFFYVLNIYKFRGKNYLFILPIVQLFWVNIHGSHILGLMTPLIFLVGEGIAVYSGNREAPIFTKKQFINLTLAIVALVIATLINPAGFKAFLFPFFLTGQTLYMQNIQEWQPLRLVHLIDLDYGIRYTWGFSLLLTLCLFVFIRQFKKIDFTELLTFFAFLYLAVKGIRLLPEFAIAVGPIVARRLNLFSFPKISSRFERIKFITPLILTVCIGIIFYLVVLNSKTYAFGLGLKERVFPVKTVDFLRHNNIQGNMFNSIGYGGYLIWRLFPEQKVFIDGRNDVYKQDFYKSYLDAHLTPDAWQKVVKDYDIDWVILEYSRDYARKERIAHLIENPEWALIYWDREAIVYAKRGSRNKDIIKRFEYRYARPNELNPTYLNRYIVQRERIEEIVQEFKRNLSMNPDNEESHLSLAYIYFNLGMRNEEFEEWKKVVTINPDIGFAHVALGELYMQRGDMKMAKEAFQRALDINPDDKAAITGLKRLKERNLKE